MNSKTLSLKGFFTKLIATAALAGAVLLAAPQKADAQSFSVGIGFGHPHPYYGRPVYGPPVYGGFYGPGPGFYAERRREEFIRHQEWVRAHEFHPGYRGYYGR